MTTNKYFYIKLYEDTDETSYTGYVKKRSLFKVKSNGDIENLNTIVFDSIPAGTDIVLTHVGISDDDETYTILRHLKKRIKLNKTDDQIPKFLKGEIKTSLKQPIRARRESF